MYGILRVTQGPDVGRAIAVMAGKTVVLGRRSGDPEGLSDRYVSRKHCEVKLENGKALLTDAGSAAGTLVNGERVTQRELRPGDLIVIGQTHLSFQWSREDEVSTGLWQPGET